MPKGARSGPARRRGPGRPTWARHAVVCLAAICASDAWAQASAARAVSVTPSLRIAETLTDARRRTDGTTSWDSITSITPAIRVSSRAGRLQGSLDYSLSANFYARDSSANSLHHRLGASRRAELVQDHLTVDMAAGVARQSTSALSLQSPESNLAGSGQTHVSNYSISPSLRGRPGGLAELSARLLVAGTDSGTSSISNSTNLTASARVASPTPGALVGWYVDASRQVVDFERGRRSESDRLVGGLSLRPDVDWQLRLRVGIEDSDIATLTKERTDTYGAGATWTPTERTLVSLDLDQRSFGHSHALNVQHRMRRVIVRMSDRQDVTSGADAGRALVTAYDLFFALFASQEPDPIKREQLVNSFLLRNNLSPQTPVNGGLLSSSSALQRRQEVSLAVQGQRTNVVVSGFRVASRRAFDLVGVPDDLAAGDLAQRGINFNVSHQLTPTSSLGFGLSGSRARSEQTGTFSKLEVVTLNWSERLSRRATVSLGLRHSQSETSTERLDENALLANLYLLF